MRNDRIKKNKIIFSIFLALTVTWLVVIFVFSAKNGSESTNTSRFVGMLFGKIFVPGFRRWPFEKQYDFAGIIDIPLRKTAHALEYGFLGILSLFTFYFGNMAFSKTSKKNKVIDANSNEIKQKSGKLFPLRIPAFAFIFTVLYAASDEIHQLFVPGREGKVTDVLIDSAGALFFICITSLILSKKLKKISKTSSLSSEEEN